MSPLLSIVADGGRGPLPPRAKAFRELGRFSRARAAITAQSSAALSQVPDASVDCVFVDPPFGADLQSSEPNQIWEAWLRVRTNRAPEAIIDATRARGEREHTAILRGAFAEMYRVLKPGRFVRDHLARR